MPTPWDEGRDAAEKMVAMKIRPTPPQWYSEAQVRQWYAGMIERAAEIKRARDAGAGAGA